MTDGTDRRRPGQERWPLRVPVSVVELPRTAHQLGGEAANISAGGAMLRIPAALAPGKRLAVTFQFRQHAALATAAIVRWATAETRGAWAIGVAFREELAPGIAAEIASLS